MEEEKKVYEGYKRTTTTRTRKKTTTEDGAVETLTETEKNPAPKTTRKRTTARMAGKATGKPRLAMFIDVDNAGITRENLLEILFFANGKYQIEQCKLYGFSEDTLPGIRDFASEYNVTTIGRMQFKQPGVNCLDSRLLIDAYECALNNKNKIDMIFVWCYPCDLESLFEKIVNLGINTATIDNSIFDCKNKFVSQTFKLYSPYHFIVEQSTYGKIKNEPSTIAPNNNLENPLPSAQPTPTKPVPTEKPADKHVAQDGMIEGVIPPVLPRRQIVERSNPNAPKPQSESETSQTATPQDSVEKPGSLVEAIARKLNLDLSSNENLEKETSNTPNNTSELFMNMLKQAGFDNTNKPLKYEDTIGDL